MRFFIALEIPEESKRELAILQQKVSELIPQSRLTDIDKLHLTIAFVGEQPDEMKDELAEVLRKAALEVPSFSVAPAYLDGFPSVHEPHVLWVGVKGDIDKLFILRERVKDGLISLNLDVDERRFIPHIAIAKISNYDLDPQVEEQFQAIMTKTFTPINVNSVKLFESIPNHGFHHHNTLANIQLTPPILTE